MTVIHKQGFQKDILPHMITNTYMTHHTDIQLDPVETQQGDIQQDSEHQLIHY